MEKTERHLLDQLLVRISEPFHSTHQSSIYSITIENEKSLRTCEIKGFVLNRQNIVLFSNRIGVILFNYKFDCPSISL